MPYTNNKGADQPAHAHARNHVNSGVCFTFSASLGLLGLLKPTLQT